MKSERGKEVLWRLVNVSDVLVENFRTGAMERLGFGYEAVRARHPAMIYCSISGFGDTGPQKDRAGYDVIVQGEAGIMDLTGPRDGPPHKVGTSIADLVSGLTAAQGILAALYAAKIDGRGSGRMSRCTRRLQPFSLSIEYLFRNRNLAHEAGQRTCNHRSLPDFRVHRRLDQPGRRE